MQLGIPDSQPRGRDAGVWNVRLNSPMLVTGLVVFAAYYLGAKIGFALTFQPHPVSVLWPPNSILVAALLLTPPRIWWFILLAAFPAHWAAQLQSHVPPLMILCWFISNSCEAVISAGLTRYLVGGPIRFKSLREAGIFCLCAVLVGPFLSSFLDAAFVIWNHWGQDAYWKLIRIRFPSNALAALIVAPLIVTWVRNGIPRLRRAQLSSYLEACVLFIILFSVSYVVLYAFGPRADSALLFLPLPFLLWVAVRFGSLGTSSAISIVGFLAIWSAAHGHGPFSGGTVEQDALSIQIFLIVLAIPLLFLATVIEERATRETELRESEARINLAANAANLGLWLWRIPGNEIWVTEQWRRLFGFTDLEPVTFDRLLQVVHPGDRERMKQLVQHMLEHGGEYESEYRITGPDGSTRWIAGHGRVELDEYGKPAFARGVSRDVTRRKHGEEALLESEARFRTIADTAPMMIWMAGLDKLCTFFNKPWLEFTGRSIEQELGNGWAEGVHPDDLQKCLKTYVEAFDAREPFVMQYRLRRHDGEYRWISDNGVPRYDAQENFTGYIGSCVDVTELLGKERALRESEERMSLVMDAANLGLWEWDPNEDELWGTKTRRALLGLSGPAKIKLEDVLSRVHADDRDRVRQAMKDAVRTGESYHFEYRVVLPDGSVRWTEHRGRCVSEAAGKSPVLRGVSIDVTAQKQAQDLFRLATEASPIGTLLVNDQGRILLVNAHVEELFGYEREELIGKPVEVLVPERFAKEYAARRAEFLGAPKMRPAGTIGEVSARRKDGTDFPVEVGLNPIQTPQGILVLATVADISQRKFAEEEARRQREQINLLTRLSLLGEMTASLAHELNQPLSAIMSNANAAMQYIANRKLDPAQLQEILTDVVADGQRAHNIIHNVRDAIKKGGAIRCRINLNDVVKAVRHMISADAAGQSCKVEMSLAEDLPTIEGDPTQMQQVLINLVRNALDAMRDTPLNRREVEIATNYDGNATVHVAVRDHGCGISETVGERLFEQFFTTKEEGLGMGLAIVRSIIEAHGGRIAAENVDGGGARFYFNLPTNEKAPQ